MRLMTAALMLVFSVPASAEVVVTFPVSIPQECVALAMREGVPTVMANKYQAASAKHNLDRLSGSDPLVQTCRAAVARARQAAATN